MQLTPAYAELLGILFGDGCLSHHNKKYIVYISGHKFNDYDYHTTTTKKLLKDLFNKQVTIKFRKNENTLFIRFSDKRIFNILHDSGMPIGKKYSQLIIPPKILIKSTLLFPFLRGLIDTDGCVIFSKQHRQYHYYPRIEITSKSQSFLKQILLALQQHQFYGSVSNKGRGHRLEFPGFKNFNQWITHIGFNNPSILRKIEAQMGLYAPEEDRTPDLAVSAQQYNSFVTPRSLPECARSTAKLQGHAPQKTQTI